MATKRKPALSMHAEDVKWLEESKLLQRVDFIEAVQGSITGVFCKRCGRQIQGMIPSARPARLLKSGPRTVEQLFVRIGALPMYTEVEMMCDDGSKHVSACCKECAPVLTADDLDAFLIADTRAEIKQGGMTEGLLMQRVMRRVKREETD